MDFSSETRLPKLKIAKADVAFFMLDQLNSQKYMEGGGDFELTGR